MGLLLDMQTMLVTLVIGHLFTAMFIIAYWRQHQNERTISYFFYAKCGQAVAWLILFLRDGNSDTLTISLVNSILFIGYTLEIIAILQIQNAINKLTMRFYSALLITNIVGFHSLLLFYNEEQFRIAFVSLGMAAGVMLPAFKMIQTRGATMLTRVIGYFYLIVIVVLLIRFIRALFFDSLLSYYHSNANQTLMLLAQYFAMIAGNTGFILLMKEQSDQALLRLANYDDLTGTLNRRTFITRTNQFIAAYAKKKKPITLMLFDIDYFKSINDSFGHDVGDRVLIALTTKLKEQLGQLGENVLFARYGGDEFAILLPDMDETESSHYSEGIRQAAERSHIPEQTIPCTISLGILTVIPDEKTHIEELYSTCDKALYHAKRNGRNGVFRGSMDRPVLPS